MTPDTGERLFVFRGFAPTVLSGEELRASESQPVTGMSVLSRPHSLGDGPPPAPVERGACASFLTGPLSVRTLCLGKH